VILRVPDRGALEFQHMVMVISKACVWKSFTVFFQVINEMNET
jgi:hypothetical protein